MKKGRAKRGNTQDVLKRQREMLELIPLRPRKISAREIFEKLQSRGFKVSRRSVERDLHNLKAAFGIDCDQGMPQGWSYVHRYPQVNGIDISTALTLKLAYAHVSQLVPASLLADLKTLVETAEKTLESTRGNDLSLWPKKVRVLSSGPARTPPKIDPAVHLEVSGALLKNRQLRVRYKSLARGKMAEYVVSPLGMVLKGGLIYLLVWREDKEGPFKLVLHRISKAEIEHLEAKTPPGWGGIDAYIEDGNFMFPPGPVEKECLVTLRFDSMSAQNLQEMPLSADQTIKEEVVCGPDGKPYFLVRARVTVSEEFVRWLFQFGECVEVIRPASLRDRMHKIVENLNFRYE